MVEQKLAQLVSEELNCKCVSREMLLETASTRYGLESQQLADTLEKPPSLWERITKGSRVYLAVLRAALLESACSEEMENIVYHGHAGHFSACRCGFGLAGSSYCAA